MKKMYLDGWLNYLTCEKGWGFSIAFSSPLTKYLKLFVYQFILQHFAISC
jgi:hypothetical protein